MTIRALALVCLAPLLQQAQQLPPDALLKPAPDSWPTYNGDYSGRRHSSLTQINAANVSGLSTAWVYRAILDHQQNLIPDP